MLKTLTDFFDSLFAPGDAAAANSDRALQVATAVMLVEVMRADADMSEAERALVVAALHAQFALAPGDVSELLACAEQASRHASDYFSFTSLINQRFDMAQKLRMVEDMWRVAYADGLLSDHENHVMWRLADLLHIPHGAYVNAKVRAQQAARR